MYMYESFRFVYRIQTRLQYLRLSSMYYGVCGAVPPVYVSQLTIRKFYTRLKRCVNLRIRRIA